MIEPVDVAEVWVDGGVVGPNPSPHGGTWAFCWVSRDGKCLRKKRGIILPKDIGMEVVTNNVSELMAAVMGLESLPQEWDGVLWTDSRVTWLRLTNSSKFNGVPKWLMRRALDLRMDRRWKPMMCAGHPTKEQLQVGWNRKGTPVSIHNVRCDKGCTELARRYLEGLR